MKKLVRLAISLVVMAIVYLIIKSYPNPENKIHGIIGGFVIGLTHFICWDLLDLDILDNFLGKLIKRVLFYGVLFLTIYDSFMVGKAEIAIEHNLFDHNSHGPEIYLSGSILGTIVAGLLCYGSSLSGWSKYISPFIGVIAWLFTLGGGFIISSLALGSRGLATILLWIILIGGLVFLLMLQIGNGLIYKYRYGVESGNRSGRLSYSTNYRDTGNPIADLSYFMSSLAMKYSMTRGCSYGVTARTRVSQSLYGDDASFTVDISVDTTCCTAQNQNDMSWVIGDVQKFQKEIMNDIYREMSSYINKLKNKHNDFYGVNLSINPGDISEY